MLEPAEETPNLIEVEFDGNEQQAAQLLLNLARAELPVADFHREDDSLERLFLQLVNDHVTEEQL